MLRIGHGYDVHVLAEDRRLVLGGVDIPHDKGLLGHSDADVLIHAVIDAILGALARGDIGAWFPDTDNAYKGADSRILLRKVATEMYAQGWRISNLDTTICASRPRLQPHIHAMRHNLAQDLDTAIDNVSVKATTEEGLGVSGAGGISATAIVLLTQS